MRQYTLTPQWLLNISQFSAISSSAHSFCYNRLQAIDQSCCLHWWVLSLGLLSPVLLPPPGTISRRPNKPWAGILFVWPYRVNKINIACYSSRLLFSIVVCSSFYDTDAKASTKITTNLLQWSAITSFFFRVFVLYRSERSCHWCRPTRLCYKGMTVCFQPCSTILLLADIKLINPTCLLHLSHLISTLHLPILTFHPNLTLGHRQQTLRKQVTVRDQVPEGPQGC